jgi:hypothetical protein
LIGFSFVLDVFRSEIFQIIAKKSLIVLTILSQICFVFIMIYMEVSWSPTDLGQQRQEIRKSSFFSLGISRRFSDGGGGVLVRFRDGCLVAPPSARFPPGVSAMGGRPSSMKRRGALQERAGDVDRG